MNRIAEWSLPDWDPTLTMTSLEVAELTGKRHDNVLVKIRELSASGVLRGLPEIQEKYQRPGQRGRPVKLCRLNRTESINLVANLCPLFTQKIINRWQELEQGMAETGYQQLQALSVEMKVSERLGQIGSGLMNERKQQKRTLAEQEQQLLAGCQLRLDFCE